MKRRQSRRRTRSRIAIMHAAKKLFEEKGIGHVTFNDIAQESGMSRTTIFNHFSTINDLLYALVIEEIEALEEEYQSVGKTGEEAIVALFEKLFRDTVDYPVLTCKLLSYGVIREDLKPRFQVLEEIVQDNLPDLSEEEKCRRSILIFGIYYGLVNHFFINRRVFDADLMASEFQRLASSYMR